jgi:hypothetical protein
MVIFLVLNISQYASMIDRVDSGIYRLYPARKGAAPPGLWTGGASFPGLTAFAKLFRPSGPRKSSIVKLG